MNRYVIEEFYQDPALRQRLFSQARVERARWVKSAFAWLRQHLTPRRQTRGWLARLG